MRLKGLVFTLFTERCSFKSPALHHHPSTGAHGSTYALSLPLSVFLYRPVEKKKEEEEETPYDWQKHPHAHVKITIKVNIKRPFLW